MVQVNAFEPSFRPAVIELLLGVADQCDGLRCDMAMLLINNIFARTWGDRAGQMPATEYWSDVITAIKQRHPHFVFIAEAYWDLEWELQQQGFDYCYDKRLYDRLELEESQAVAFTSAPSSPIKRSSSVSLKTTTSPGPQPHSPPPKHKPQL